MNVDGEVDGRTRLDQPYGGDPAGEYQALREAAGLADLGRRSRLTLAGADRAKILHNLCTADVKALAVGQGAEAFFTNVKGHTIGHGYIFAGADRLHVDASPDAGAKLAPHFDRYILREDAQVADVSASFHDLWLGGPHAASVLATLGLPAPSERLAFAEIPWRDGVVFVAQLDYAGPEGFLITSPADLAPALWNALTAAGARPCGGSVVEAARIEHGAPVFGQDLSDDNLPQEIDRDRWAISFRKGCYLGQETVARIDALGHVNKVLARLVAAPLDPSAEPPAKGAELRLADKIVGRVTSSAVHPQSGAFVLLAYVKRDQRRPGAEFTFPGGTAHVV